MGGARRRVRHGANDETDFITYLGYEMGDSEQGLRYLYGMLYIFATTILLLLRLLVRDFR